jgi:hypothetical protein
MTRSQTEQLRFSRAVRDDLSCRSSEPRKERRDPWTGDRLVAIAASRLRLRHRLVTSGVLGLLSMDGRWICSAGLAPGTAVRWP